MLIIALKKLLKMNYFTKGLIAPFFVNLFSSQLLLILIKTIYYENNNV